MRAQGTIYKQCGCRDPLTRRLVGRSCPKLRRADGRWHPRHGSWGYQLELPPTPQGKRRNPLRRGGFTSVDEVTGELEQARELLLAISTDPATRNKIADLITDTVKQTRRLPDPDTVRRKVRAGQDVNRRILFGDWLDTWLKGKKRISEGTRARYASDVKLYLKPYLGHIPVEELRVTHFDDLFEAIEEYNEVIRQARASGDLDQRAAVKWRRVVNPPTLRNIQATARHALNVAIKPHRLIEMNPAAVVELPPADRPKPLVWTPQRVAVWQAAHQARLADVRARAAGGRVDVIAVYVGTPRPSPVMVWTPDQTRRFLDYATRHRLYLLYRLIALRGLRRGEACGVRIQAIDLEHAVVGVSWQITQLGWNPRQGRPKTEASDRTIPLDQVTVTLFTDHLAEQGLQRVEAGLGEAEFVFTDEAGAPLHPAHVTDQFQWLAYQAGLPPIRLHDLRHVAASLMLAAGIDIKIVQETLGHVTSAYTRDTYTSVYPELSHQAADDTAALLNLGPNH